MSRGTFQFVRGDRFRVKSGVGIEEDRDMADAAIIGAAHMARGFVFFPEWSEKILSDSALGERFRPLLPILFEQSKQYYRAVQMEFEATCKDDEADRQDIPSPDDPTA